MIDLVVLVAKGQYREIYLSFSILNFKYLPRTFEMHITINLIARQHSISAMGALLDYHLLPLG